MVLFAVLAAAQGLAPSSGQVEWRQTLSPHFTVMHEAAWAPPGFVMTLERLHNRLRRDLAMFSPWMAKERLKLYLYKDRASYLAGEFSPPAWSNGIALYQRKIVAVYDQQDRRKLAEIVAHETTHLLFESYWGEAGKAPPSWLNEGLAMLEEAEASSGAERSPWYRAMAALPRGDFLPMARFLEMNPTHDLKDDKEKVGVWYIQAFSLVYFLSRERTRLQFKDFCARLRDGKPLPEALWLVYRFQGAAKLEKAWKEWLASPVHLKRAQLITNEPEDKDKPKGVKGLEYMKGFNSLRP